MNNHIIITATASIDTPTQVGVLTIQAGVENVSVNESQSVTIKGDPRTVVLFSGSVAGADVAGNTLNISIGRSPDNGDDTGKYSAIRLENINVGVTQVGVSGVRQANQMSFSL